MIFISISAMAKDHLHVNELCDSLPKRNEKIYCADFREKVRYSIVIKGNNISITSLYKPGLLPVTGKIIKGKIYSNSPYEKDNKFAVGRYYILEGKTFKILDTENRDYQEYKLCNNR
jgi:hypothetical protein